MHSSSACWVSTQALACSLYSSVLLCINCCTRVHTQTLARTLATMRLDLDDDDEEEDGDPAPGAAAGAPIPKYVLCATCAINGFHRQTQSACLIACYVHTPHKACSAACFLAHLYVPGGDHAAAAAGGDTSKGPHDKSYGAGPYNTSTSGAISLFVSRKVSPADQVDMSELPRWKAMWLAVKAALLFWRPRVVPSTSKRVLHQSLRQSVLLTWAVLAWGVMIIVCYAIGVSQLANIAGPIAR